MTSTSTRERYTRQKTKVGACAARLASEVFKVKRDVEQAWGPSPKGPARKTSAGRRPLRRAFKSPPDLKWLQYRKTTRDLDAPDGGGT